MVVSVSPRLGSSKGLLVEHRVDELCEARHGESLLYFDRLPLVVLYVRSDDELEARPHELCVECA